MTHQILVTRIHTTNHSSKHLSFISDQLPEFLNRHGIEAACEEWQTAPPPPPGSLSTGQDGQMWNTILGSDGEPFFQKNPDHDELRIGIQVGFDG
jgi:hypothetical protein